MVSVKKEILLGAGNVLLEVNADREEGDTFAHCTLTSFFFLFFFLRKTSTEEKNVTNDLTVCLLCRERTRIPLVRESRPSSLPGNPNVPTAFFSFYKYKNHKFGQIVLTGPLLKSWSVGAETVGLDPHHR